MKNTIKRLCLMGLAVTMLGTSIDFWLNLQSAFDEKVIELRGQGLSYPEIAKRMDASIFLNGYPIEKGTVLG